MKDPNNSSTSTVMDHGDLKENELKDLSDSPRKRSSLRLDKASMNRPVKTRNELYQELNKSTKGQTANEENLNLANPILRIMALVVDVLFIAIVFKICSLIAPYELQMIQGILGKYHLQMMFSPEINLLVVLVASLFISAFFLIIIPVTFFHASLGKKITGLHVRGDNKPSLSIKQVMKRELFYKPLGMILLIGFILPFFDKRKKSLHDKLCGTFVIKNKH